MCSTWPSAVRSVIVRPCSDLRVGEALRQQCGDLLLAPAEHGDSSAVPRGRAPHHGLRGKRKPARRAPAHQRTASAQRRRREERSFRCLVTRDEDDAAVARGRAGVRSLKGELIFAAHEFPGEKSALAAIGREFGSPSDLHPCTDSGRRQIDGLNVESGLESRLGAVHRGSAGDAAAGREGSCACYYIGSPEGGQAHGSDNTPAGSRRARMAPSSELT
jgi:hypothetical protein